MGVVIEFCVFREAGKEAVVDMGGEVMGVKEAILVHLRRVDGEGVVAHESFHEGICGVVKVAGAEHGGLYCGAVSLVDYLCELVEKTVGQVLGLEGKGCYDG